MISNYDPDMQPLMVDVGHEQTKLGFSGDDAPRAIIPTIVGRSIDPINFIGMDQKDTFVGDEAYAKRGILDTKNPIPNSLNEGYDFDLLEKIFQHSFYNELCVAPEEHPVMFTTLHRMDRNDLRTFTEILYETFSLPALYISDSSVLSLFATGKTTGQVVDCGSSVSSTCSILEGFPILHTKLILENRLVKEGKRVSGDLLTDVFHQLLEKNQKFGQTSSPRPPENKRRKIAEEMSLRKKVKLMKDMFLSFSLSDENLLTNDERDELAEFKVKYPKLRTRADYGNYPGRFWFDRHERKNQEMLREYRNLCQKQKKGVFRKGSNVDITFELPDGKFVEIGNERFDTPETLFRPTMLFSIFGSASKINRKSYYGLPGIHQMVRLSVESCNIDKDLQKKLYHNLVLSGGTTEIINFRPKLHYELQNIITDENLKKYLKITATKTPRRKYLAWSGGSIMSSLVSFEREWVLETEFKEKGYRAVEVKCQRATFQDNGVVQDKMISSFHLLNDTEMKDLEERRSFIFMTDLCFLGKGNLQKFSIILISTTLNIKFRSLLLL